MKRLLLAMTVIAMVLLIAGTATAQRGCELAHECGGNLPQEIPEGSLEVWHPIPGVWDLTSPDELMIACRYFGGYYYLAEDVRPYWYSC